MSNPENGPKLSLKVVINKQKTKVLFAEAKSDFVDVLLSFLTLPLGKVVTILGKHYGEEAPAIGSLNTLYAGLLNLDDTYFSVRGAKQMLLSPQSSLGAECLKLALDVTDSTPIQYFLCQDVECDRVGDANISLYSDIATCYCGKSLNRKRPFEKISDGGVFTINPLTFIVTDDLSVAPIVTGIIQTLNNLGVADTQGAEMKSYSFGIDEIRDLLKFSLTSATPLTDVIIKKTRTSSTAAKPEPAIPLYHIQKDDASCRKMVIKVCLQKSTNKFLFAEAMDDFVGFLFGFLTVPVGGVEFLLGGNTCLKSIDNLYWSVSNGFDEEYFTNPDTKNRLINPKLPHGYISKNQFLPLSEEAPPKLYYKWERNDKLIWKRKFYRDAGTLVSSFKSSKENYVKKQTMCFVTDDLNVSTSLATTGISILNALGIPFSDVKETELHIGLEEALRILKASLTSKTALTDALIKPLLNKQPKLERQPKQER